jgi:hypothetical protein
LDLSGLVDSIDIESQSEASTTGYREDLVLDIAVQKVPCDSMFLGFGIDDLRGPIENDFVTLVSDDQITAFERRWETEH